MSLIRRAESRDIADLMRLLEQVNFVHHRGRPDLFRLGTKYTAEELADILADASRPVFVFEDDGGRVQGYAFCVHQQHTGSRLMTDIRTLYIDDLCVDEGCRGQGIGRALYRHVLGYARETGCWNVTLNVWALNPGAQRFYESCGMQVQKTGMECVLGAQP